MDIKRNIQYIVIDLDGTLLNDEHKLSDRNKEAIKKAIAQGIKVIIATGKTRKSAEAMIKDLNLDTPGVFVQENPGEDETGIAVKTSFSF